MVLKKNLIKDLKKSNDELDSYLEDLNLSQIPFEKIIKTNSSQEVDYLKVIGTSVIDLRTEMALMRKNLSNDVESMVLKTIEKSQGQFSQLQNNLHFQLLHEVKENFAGYISEISEELIKMKTEFKKQAFKEDLITNSISSLNKNILILNSELENFTNSQIKLIDNNDNNNNSSNQNLDFIPLNKINLSHVDFDKDPIETGVDDLILNESKNVLELEKRLKRLDSLK